PGGLPGASYYLRLPVAAAASAASGWLVHPAHSATTGHRRSLVLLLLLHHDALSREEQARDGRGVLQSGASHLRRVDDAGRDQVLELIGLGVVAEVLVLRLLLLADHARAFRARVLRDGAARLLAVVA